MMGAVGAIDTSPLSGRVALVTGISRSNCVGAAVAERLRELGAVSFATGWPDHDAGRVDAGSVSALGFDVGRHDLEDPQVPAALVDEVVERHGRIDIVIAAHARSSSQRLADVTAEEMDRSWAINVRSVVLLAQRFAELHEVAPSGQKPIGRMVWFTSGQHLEPIQDTLVYAATKGALHQLTSSIARALADSRVVANCINPGPVDTGWADADTRRRVAAMFPDGRWGTPSDVADLVAFLVSDQGAWIRGQVLNSEGGFDRRV